MNCFEETAEFCRLRDNVFGTQRKRLELRGLCFPRDQLASSLPCQKGSSYRTNTVHGECIRGSPNRSFRIFTGIYSLFKCEPLSANTKQILHKAAVMSVMTYASLAWEFAAETYLMELQNLKKKFSAPLPTTQAIHLAASCKWFSKSACAIFCYKSYNSMEMKSRTTEQGCAPHVNYRRHMVGCVGGYLTAVQVSALSLQQQITR